jgi:hypothetical protein
MTRQQQQLLTSLRRSVRAAIRRTEGDFADGVLADFQYDLRCSANPIKAAYRWLRHYRQFTHI